MIGLKIFKERKIFINVITATSTLQAVHKFMKNRVNWTYFMDFNMSEKKQSTSSFDIDSREAIKTVGKITSNSSSYNKEIDKDYFF